MRSKGFFAVFKYRVFERVVDGEETDDKHLPNEGRKKIIKVFYSMVCLILSYLIRFVQQIVGPFAIRDGFPVTELHSLVIPRRHVSDYFDLTKEELIAFNELLQTVREDILSKDASVKGFNIGVNAGAVFYVSSCDGNIDLITASGKM